jgi:hypothetical protein
MTDKTEEKVPDFSGLLIALAAAPLYWVLASLGYEDIGRTAGLSLGMVLIAVRFRWYLRKHNWFWVTIVLVLLLHIPLILEVKWSENVIPGIALLPIGALDLLAILGVIRLAEKLLNKPTSSEDPE